MTTRATCLVVAICGAACLFPAASNAASFRTFFAPAQPTDSEIVHVTVLGEDTSWCAAAIIPIVDLAASKVTLHGYFEHTPAPPCAQPWWSSQATVGHLRAGVWQVELRIEEQPISTTTLIVQPSPTLVTIGTFAYYGSNFRIQVEWRDPRNGQVGLAPGMALSDLAAQFWFFDPRNPEVTVKILDGWAINSHHWLFASTLSGVEMTIRITQCVESDPPFCDTPKEYHVPAGTGLDIIDVTAF